MAGDGSSALHADSADKLQAASRNLADFTREVVDDITDVRDDITGHIVGMVQNRLEHVTKSFGDIAKAKSPIDASQIYTEFLLDSMQRSAQQFSELGRIITRLNMRIWSPLFTPRRLDGGRHLDGGAQASFGGNSPVAPERAKSYWAPMRKDAASEAARLDGEAH